MKILFCAYRPWALSSVESLLVNSFDIQQENHIFIAKTRSEFDSYQNSEFDLVFFVGWSWKVSQSFVERNKTFCFHPSPLPKYRGGSPLQHQIINGETKSVGTFFKMTREIDSGPIVWQKPFSLEGELNEILSRLTDIVAEGLLFIIKNTNALVYVDQVESQSTYFTRRTAAMSEISTSDIQNMTAAELHNKIRALQDPYPNAFIVTKDGRKLYLLKSKIED